MRAHPLAVVLVSLFASHLAAQATTWTSFEDRRGHAMASTPIGGVVMFGGERVSQPGARLSDAHRLATGSQNWSRIQSGPQGLVKHSLAGIVVNGQPKYFLFGGLTSNGQPTAATWVNDGSSWDPRGQTGAQPTARSAQGMVGGQLGGVPRIWVFGGTDGVSQLNDLWSYDPAADQWTFLGPQQGQPVGTWPSARSSHAISFVQGEFPGD